MWAPLVKKGDVNDDVGWVRNSLARRLGLLIPAGVAVVAAASVLLAYGAPAAASQGTAGLPNLSLPSPSPLPSVPALPTVTVTPPAVPSPSLPPVHLPSLTPSPVALPSVPIATPTPSIPPVGSLPGASPSASPAPGTGGPGSSSTSGGASSGGSDSGGGIHIPFTGFVVRSPFDIALMGALAVLPLLGGIWLLLFGRTWSEARKARDAGIRLMLAGELGIAPRELASLSTKSLFKLREEAAFDDLTGVLRRAAGMSALEREIARARRQKAPLTVAFLDVDGLKQANDSRGHKAGDDLLRGMAKALTSGLRGQDLVVRYGGDEFVCALPDTAYVAARAKLSWVQDNAAQAGIHFSAGFAQLERTDDVVSLLGRADRELYEAKARRVSVAPIEPLPTRGGRRQVSA